MASITTKPHTNNGALVTGIVLAHVALAAIVAFTIITVHVLSA